MRVKKNTLIYIVTIFLSLLYIFIANKLILKGESFFHEGDTASLFYAKVLSVGETQKSPYGDQETPFKAEILKGEYQGKIVNAVQQLDAYLSVNQRQLKVNDKLYLHKHEDASNTTVTWYFDSYDRISGLTILALLFVVFIVLFGKRKGVNTIVALIFTCMAIFMVYIPAILKGYNIYFWSIITCIFICYNTLLIVQGTTKKSIVAIVGTLSGTAVSGILTLIMSKVLSLTGMLEEESFYLYSLNEEHPIDLRAIIFGAIIVGAIGAIMDVAIDIASSLNEVVKALEKPNRKRVIESGFEIGRDIIGTMSNTLVLAYIGGSLSCTLLSIVYSGTLTNLLNREMIVTELLQALVGSLGIFATIPLTTYISATIYLRDAKKKQIESTKPKKEKITKDTFREDPFEKKVLFRNRPW